jgi:16S rRNA (adenine1518-N6/adenine1519-N6)-dimethyltransferase
LGAAIDLPALNIPSLLRRHGLSPNKGLGQNFLIDEHFLEQIALAAEITGQDAVLEVGAGAGSLTRWLAQMAGKVVAVEKDFQLIPVLKEVVGANEKVHIIAGDILQLDAQKIMDHADYLVAANIPYYITSALFRHLLEGEHKPLRMVLTIQAEVARRICASAGQLSLLALSVQVYGNPQIVLDIPAAAFYPAPKVNSAVLRVDLHARPSIPPELMDDFFRLIKAGFSQKRKMLHNTLCAGLAWPKAKVDELLKQAGVDPQRRAQTLTMQEWRRLAEEFHAN